MDAGTFMDAANQLVENPAFPYIWRTGWGLFAGAIVLVYQIHSVKVKIHSVEMNLTNEIRSQLDRMRARMEPSEAKFSAQIDKIEQNQKETNRNIDQNQKETNRKIEQNQKETNKIFGRCF